MILSLGLNIFSQENIVDSNNKFSFKIYSATNPKQTNFFISPLSINIALAMTNEGAVNKTRNEIDSLLCLANSKYNTELYQDFIQKTIDLNDSIVRKCTSRYNYTEGENKLYIANSLWIEKNFKIKNDYKRNIKNNFYSNIFYFDSLNVSDANNNLNKWVSENTNNRINHIVNLNKNDKVCILNAVYFMGMWDEKFEKGNTLKKPFTDINKNNLIIDFMNKKSIYKYYEDSLIQSVLIPYKCNQFSMLVLLPKGNIDLPNFENNLNNDYFSRIIKNSNFNLIELSIPKYKIESEVSLGNTLKRMGCSDMFTDSADFSNTSDSKLKVDVIIHKTFIEIDEEKTEAAAVTAVIRVRGGGSLKEPEYKIFNADHPFMFIIIDNRTNAILFMGRFVTK